ncbi:MAG: DUF5916 domain-containing protein [candidate division Zixibacteria bacterium]
MNLHTNLKTVALTWALMILLCSSALLAQENYAPNVLPAMSVPRLSGEIKIDGNSDDSGWKSAALANNFAETNPGDNIAPPVKTEVLVCYDQDNFYMLFKAFDDPEKVRATMTDRDNMFQDDYIGIIFDTYGDLAWAYELFINPYGIQGDLRWNHGNEDGRFDIVWQSEGSITDDGWQVEVAIPFKSLRFPDSETQTWRVNFWRNHPRDSRRRYSWVAIDRDNPCWLCNFGTLTGIENVSPGGSLELLPAMVATQSGEYTFPEDKAPYFSNNNADAELSLSTKYAVASDLTAEVTLNPDFSQIASDATQINVNSTFALYFPERRPFFQAGSDLFNMPTNIFYPRTINNPQVAGKLYGRLGRTSVAFISAWDENTVAQLPFQEFSLGVQLDKAIVNVLRVKHSILDDSYLGMTLTDRRHEGQGPGAGSIYSVDGRLRFLRNINLSFQIAGSHTEELNRPGLFDSDLEAETFDYGKHTIGLDGEKFNGYSLSANIGRQTRLWDVNLGYRANSPTFRAENGFINQTDFRMVDLWTGLFFRQGNHPLFDIISPRVSIGRKWNFEGMFKDEWIRPELYLSMKAQTSVTLSFLVSQEHFRDSLITGIQRYEIDVESRFSKVFGIGFDFETGHSLLRNLVIPALGQTYEFGLGVRIRPTDRLTIQPEFDFERLTLLDNTDSVAFAVAGKTVTPGQELSSTWVLRTNLSYQFTRRLFVRTIIEYYDQDSDYDADDRSRGMSVEPLLTYKISPFTIFYIGSGHGYTDYNYTGLQKMRRSSQQFFAKLQYLFSG